ncbi:MAG: PAS domain-containing hybrid sensor histidine kinase/response regulator [Thermotogota bacterium]
MKQMSNQIMNHLGQGLVILDDKGNFEYFNKKFLEMVEYSTSDLEKYNLFDLTEKIDGVDVKKIFNERLKGNESSYEAVLISKTGNRIPVLISGAPYYDEENNIIGVIALLTDISHSKQMEKKLKKAADEADKANKAKSKFLGNISHEIKNPLNGIIGIIDLLKETAESKENQELLKTMRDSSYHILNMLDELLDLSKIEANKMDLDKIKFSPLKIYNSLYLSYKSKSFSKDINFEIDYDDDIPDSLIGDPMRLRQILDNLLSNSFKFTKSGFIKMEFSLKEIKKDIAILIFSIVDTGIGIDKSKLEKIFEAFSQEEVSIRRKFGGTGLGLFIVNKLLALMEGKVKIQSEKNKGTSIEVEIPFKISRNNENSNINNNKDINVLFIDDNEVNLMLAKKIFKSYGYTFGTALNGKDGLELIKQHDYDLIFVDSDMPIMNGLETINIIKSSHELLNSSYIIYISSKNHTPEEISEIGADDFLLKPICKEKIKQIINRYIKK